MGRRGSLEIEIIDEAELLRRVVQVANRNDQRHVPRDISHPSPLTQHARRRSLAPLVAPIVVTSRRGARLGRYASSRDIPAASRFEAFALGVGGALVAGFPRARSCRVRFGVLPGLGWGSTGRRASGYRVDVYLRTGGEVAPLSSSAAGMSPQHGMLPTLRPDRSDAAAVME